MSAEQFPAHKETWLPQSNEFLSALCDRHFLTDHLALQIAMAKQGSQSKAPGQVHLLSLARLETPATHWMGLLWATNSDSGL